MWGGRYQPKIEHHVKGSFFDQAFLRGNQLDLKIQLTPAKFEEILTWIKQIDEKELVIPHRPMIVLPSKETKESEVKFEKSFLTELLILAKTGVSYYHPDNYPIFSYQRLNRSIRLVEINIESYYEMD
jgi:hypothetical protein